MPNKLAFVRLFKLLFLLVKALVEATFQFLMCSTYCVDYYVHEAKCRIDLWGYEDKGSDLLRSEERFPMAAE